MLNSEGRKAKTIEDAQDFIHKFLNETLGDKSEHSFSKAHDFDLFLPMMMDWVLNLPSDKNEVFTSTDELEHLYMEAAWDLCLGGILRPGPRTTNGESGGDAYGKGYALTYKGKKWLSEAHDKPDTPARASTAAPITEP